MQKSNQSNSIWESLIEFTQAHPLDFEDLADQYDIHKLQLEKFTAQQIRNKINQFESRYQKQSEDVSKTWMENQYRLFIWFLLAYFKMTNRQPEKFTEQDWNLISKSFQKTQNVCKYFYLSSKKLKTQAWTPQEDKLITDLMKSNMNKKWTDIGLELFRLSNGQSFRKPKAIRERWLSHLNPYIKKADWTLDQELQLIQNIKEFGKKWSKIAKIIGNRSQHTVKNRYNKMIQKYLKMDEHLSEENILEIIQCQYKKQQQTRLNKNKKTKQVVISQELITTSQLTKQQPELFPDINFRASQIFNPIIIIFGGLRI